MCALFTKSRLLHPKRLCRIPFTALYDGAHYLIERFFVSVNPASAFAFNSESSLSTDWDDILFLKSCDPELKGIEIEERYLEKLFPSILRKAQSIAELESLLTGSKVLHLSAHGHFNSSEPLLSYFGLNERESISVVDLYGLDLSRIRLALINTCLAGKTSVKGGDELFGLVRGLFAAGCENIISTLWTLSDRVAPVFTQNFYHELLGSNIPSQAFAHAVRALLSDPSFANPYFWACYQYHGHITLKH
jgi:CHAT domain-containing protein